MSSNAGSTFSRRASQESETQDVLEQRPQRLVLLDWVAGRGLAQDNEYLYVTDAIDNSLKRFDKTRARESGVTTQLTGQRRLAYTAEEVGAMCVLRGQLLAVTSGKDVLSIIEPGQKHPVQTIRVKYPDAPQPGRIQQSRVGVFSSVCESVEGSILVGFYGSQYVSELRLVSGERQWYEAGGVLLLRAALRSFSYSAKFNCFTLCLADNSLVVADRQFRDVAQFRSPTDDDDWEPWFSLLAEHGVCLVNDRKRANSILAYDAFNATFLFKVADEVVVYAWCFRPLKRRRSSRVSLDAPPNFNSELIVYNSQVKSVERIFFYLPTLVSNPIGSF